MRIVKAHNQKFPEPEFVGASYEARVEAAPAPGKLNGSRPIIIAIRITVFTRFFMFFCPWTFCVACSYSSGPSTSWVPGVVQSKTQWHSNVLKLLQKSSQASKTFFQLLQIKRLQLKLTNTLQNSYQIQSQHQVPRTWVKQHQKTPQTTKTNENPSASSSMHKLVPFGSQLVPTWFL